MNPEEQRESTEVRETQGPDGTIRQDTVRRSSSSRNVAATLIRLIWFIAGVIIVFLAARIVLLLLAANQVNGFVNFVYSVGGFFASPFYGIFNYTPHYGQFYFEISSVVAIIVYAIVAWGLAKLVMLTSPR